MKITREQILAMKPCRRYPEERIHFLIPEEGITLHDLLLHEDEGVDEVDDIFWVLSHIPLSQEEWDTYSHALEVEYPNFKKYESENINYNSLLSQVPYESDEDDEKLLEWFSTIIEEEEI